MPGQSQPSQALRRRILGYPARAILGMQLVTHQTGPEGKTVHRVLVEEASAIDRELYLSLLVDRSRG